VAAGEDDFAEVEFELAAELDGLAGELGQEGGVVFRVKEEGFFGFLPEFREVGGGADAEPQLAEGVEVDVALEALFDVEGGQSGPDDVGEVGGAVVEGVDGQARVVGAGQERIAGAEARADDGDPLAGAGCSPILQQSCEQELGRTVLLARFHWTILDNLFCLV
jgi:hypothetical protein